MRHRMFTVTAAAMLAAVLSNGVASGARSSGSGTTTLTVAPASCSFTVTTTWSGYDGTGYVDLYLDEQTAPFHVYSHRVSPVSLAGGSASYTFVLTGADETHSWRGQGMLNRTNGRSAPYGVGSWFSESTVTVSGCSDQ
jgi:type 1 fimbria pilin